MDYIYLNLQLFAGAMNTNVTGDSGLSVENKTFYDKNLIQEAQAELVHDQFAQKRPIPKNGGKKIEFRKFGSLPKATTPLTEGVTPDGKKLSVTSIEAEVAQYGDYIVQSDMLELTTIDNTIVEATKILGKQAGLTLDTITRNVLQSGTNVFYAPKGDGTAVTTRNGLDNTCVLTARLVKRIVAFLKKNNAPKIDGDYVCILHPYAAYELMNDPEWIDAHKYTNVENIYKGELGKIGGCRFVESSEAKVYSGGVMGCLFLGANAYGVTDIEGGGLETIVKQKGSAGTADPLNQRSSIGWKAVKTAEILIQPYLVRLECKSELSGELTEN
ncbi:MAG: N4-gp56 family major capsid protein [Oscillospiraceae bacterium]|nr:N4-gp56 family major capsid protein [Oscillospiraceae bacterium]